MRGLPPDNRTTAFSAFRISTGLAFAPDLGLDFDLMRVGNTVTRFMSPVITDGPASRAAKRSDSSCRS